MAPNLRRILRRLLPLFAVLTLVGACDDDFFTIRWEERPDTVSLYSLDRPELNLASAFNFNSRFPVEIEGSTASGTWDLAVDTEGGELVFVTPRLLGIEAEAGITAVDATSFEAFRRAPADTALYYNTEPVPVVVGQIYAIRTLEAPGRFGRRCNYFGKLEPLRVNVELGTVEFVYDASPVCNDRDLVPPQ